MPSHPTLKRSNAHADPAAVGGIYSVLKSKAQVTTAEYGAAYTLLGPWNRASVCAIAE